MKAIRLLTISIVIALTLSGCVVTKKSYTQLLSEKTALDLEKQKVELELADTRAEDEKKIAEQKNRITKLEQEVVDLQAKYDQDIAAAASRQTELSKSLEVLKEESSEETQDLLQQITELQDKYDTDLSIKNDTIDTLKNEQREKIEELNNRLDHEIQSNKLVVERLLSEIEKLEALTAEQEKAMKELADQADQLEHQLKDEIEKGEIRLKRYKTKTIINIDNSILFDSGKAEVKEGVKKSLSKIAIALNNFPENNIQIEGHTDDVPIHTAKFPSNWELSAARALAVLKFFVDKTDADPRKLSAVGHGEYHPLVPNDTPENRRLNRRVDIVILPK
ncbi:MAG: OmpA family protein [Deltaproteobacteria bacterium]|nr:MAG: OmpA family protein [Deltaproteobacteria bacterium]